LLLIFCFACGISATALIDYASRAGPFGAQVTILTRCQHDPAGECTIIVAGDDVPDRPDTTCEDAETGRRWIARTEISGASNCYAEITGGL
jgi:hypothetical protein